MTPSSVAVVCAVIDVIPVRPPAGAQLIAADETGARAGPHARSSTPYSTYPSPAAVASGEKQHSRFAWRAIAGGPRARSKRGTPRETGPGAGVGSADRFVHLVVALKARTDCPDHGRHRSGEPSSGGVVPDACRMTEIGRHELVRNHERHRSRDEDVEHQEVEE